jgi:hypothetical protein
VIEHDFGFDIDGLLMALDIIAQFFLCFFAVE